jgi:hypothetical protein
VGAWVAAQHARRAARDEVPRACIDELKAAEDILDAIRAGTVPRRQLAKVAARAVKKFDVVRMLATEAALLQHVVQIGHVPGPCEAVFITERAMP